MTLKIEIIEEEGEEVPEVNIIISINLNMKNLFKTEEAVEISMVMKAILNFPEVEEAVQFSPGDLKIF